MTNIADQRAEPAIKVTSPLVELRGVAKVYGAGRLEYVAVRGVTWPGGGAARSGSCSSSSSSCRR